MSSTTGIDTEFQVKGGLMERKLIYRSVLRGYHDDDLDADPAQPYFGLVRRVPNEAHVTAALFADLEELTRPRMIHWFLGEPVPGEPYERYEVFNVESENLILMYRIPIRPVEDDRPD
jgi:hypothetical protein